MEERKRMSDDEVLEKHSFVEKRRRMSKNVLPSDLWLNIFLRLSVTDLLSLKAVCKTFHQLISSDLFVGVHLKDFTKYPKATTAFISSTDPTASNLNYDPKKKEISVWHSESRFDYWCTRHAIRHRHRVIDSYLGYLLVKICDRLWLCNPITRSYHFLPSIYGFSLDSNCWKIAYDDVSEQYKVFGLRIWENKVCLYVFDVHRKFHLPRITTTAMEVGSDSLIKGSVLVNGNLYWLIITAQRGVCIVSANVTNEKLKTRNCHHTPLTEDNFSAANGTFYLCQGFRPACLEVWVLEGVESENLYWMMMHKIFPLPIERAHCCCQIRALGVFREKLLFIILPTQTYHQYDLSTKVIERVMFAKGDHIERELIGDDTKCEMSMGPIDIATRVPVGFIPATIL